MGFFSAQLYFRDTATLLPEASDPRISNRTGRIQIYPDWRLHIQDHAPRQRIEDYSSAKYLFEQGQKGDLDLWLLIYSGLDPKHEETYPWLLQEEFPDYEIVNFGVAGYSTVQSLLQFREALEKGKKPALVIATYLFSRHEERADESLDESFD